MYNSLNVASMAPWYLVNVIVVAVIWGSNCSFRFRIQEDLGEQIRSIKDTKVLKVYG